MIKLTAFYFSLLSILLATHSCYATEEENSGRAMQRKLSVKQQDQIIGGIHNQRSAEKIRKLTHGKEEQSKSPSPRQSPVTSSKPIAIKKTMGVPVLPQVLSPSSSPSSLTLLSPRSQEENAKKRSGVHYKSTPVDFSAVDPSYFNDTAPAEQEAETCLPSTDQ